MARKINIPALRKRLNLSQAGLAELLGVHQTTIMRIEGGRPPSKPVLKLLEQIASQS